MSARANSADRGTIAERALRAAAPTVLPSFLLCDFGNLAGEVARLEAAGARGFHLDVMDGQFVPNLTYGMPIVAALRRLTELPLDVHLMIERPERFVSAFVEAGADALTVHIEATADPAGVLRQIRGLDRLAGLALNPDTPLSSVLPHLDDCDLVLVMSVAAGFGGQAFNPVALKKLADLRSARRGLLLEVDGGIDPQTIGACRKAGADLFVVGSAIFRTADYGMAFEQLNRPLRSAT